MLNWFKAAGIRALRSVAGALLGLMGTNLVDITSLDWKTMVYISLSAGVSSLLFAIKGLPEIPAEKDMGDDVPGKHVAE